MITLGQIRAARAMLGLKQEELAKKAGISTATLNNIERGAQTDPKLSTLRAIQNALENSGIQFTEHERGGVGIRFNTPANTGQITPVLIIDDSAADRKLYKLWLSKPSDKTYRIFEAGNAKEGYEAYIQHCPACILLDFMMYGKDGFQLLVEMKREQQQLPPIVFITATNDQGIRRDVIAAGAHSCLDKKNLTRDKLRDTVAAALA